MAETQNVKRSHQQIVGLVMALVCLILTVLVWRTALAEGYFHSSAAVIFPTFCVLGLGIMVFPDSKTERVSRGEDISQMEGRELITARWWMVIIVSLTFGFGNFLLLKFL